MYPPIKECLLHHTERDLVRNAFLELGTKKGLEEMVQYLNSLLQLLFSWFM